ncbi:hypothetical protein [Chitinophaga varians]|uniref:hypothetical protein n=1 Tax=Chitinophaga varians TaxID=2202339 RepID=UPI00165F63FF|nr:hypothetical protein [Chitinophaga varians]MBC9915304.1 hypothetical protein [Chitinophaga varians]
MSTPNTPGIYGRIKDNLSMIVLLPTLLGGIWQLAELLCIHPSCIRFFSVTQLIPDGLLILSVLLLICLLNVLIIQLPKWAVHTILGSGSMAGNNKEQPDQEGIKPVHPVFGKDEIKVVITFSLSVIMLSHYFWVDTLQAAFKGKRISLWGIMKITVFCPLIFLMLKLIYQKIRAHFSPAVEIIICIVLVISLAPSIMLFLFCLKVFHNSFLLPENFKNTTNITPTSTPAREIIYFNDKYIFLNRKDGQYPDTIEVRKFEDFIQNTSPQP